MLTKRQNLIETIHGGSPDRYVNQFEALRMMRINPYTEVNPKVPKGGPATKDAWGVWKVWDEGQPGSFPLLDSEHLVCGDIEHWEKYIIAPSLSFPQEAWEKGIADMETVDRSEQFACVSVSPGLFEQLHYLQGMENAMINFLEEPEKTHELIDYLTDWEVEYASLLCKYLHPDAVFHHDDWGTQKSTFLSVDVFNEFIAPAYKKIYGYYKEHGVEIIVHHSDSFAATLVPSMIDVGIDVWQGCMSTNDIPAVIEKFGGQISVMGGIDSAWVDKPGWTPEEVEAVVRRVLDELGGPYFIPCATMGTNRSSYPGVYEKISEVIDTVNHEKFGI